MSDLRSWIAEVETLGRLKNIKGAIPIWKSAL